MFLEELQQDIVKEKISKFSPEKIKSLIKNVDDSYIRLASVFNIAYYDLRSAVNKLETSELKVKLVEYLNQFLVFEDLYYLLDAMGSSFNKPKYRNRIMYLIKGNEGKIIELISFYYKIADIENSFNSSDLSTSQFFNSN